MSAPGPAVEAPSRTARRLPRVDPQACTGCGRCVAVCPPHVMSLETVRWVKSAVLHDSAGCTACNACAVACPFHAITMRRGGGAAPAAVLPQASR